MDQRLGDLLREVETGSGQFAETPRIAREAGQFLNILVKGTRATNILEIGTQAGYATLWLAEAAAATGGKVTSVAGDVWQAEYAKRVLERSPHAEQIHFLHGDLTDIIAMLEGPYDFVLIDVDPTEVMHTFRVIIEQVSSGAFICCNKAIAHATALVEYLSYVHERPGVQSVLVPIGEGIEMTYRVP